MNAFSRVPEQLELNLQPPRMQNFPETKQGVVRNVENVVKAKKPEFEFREKDIETQGEGDKLRIKSLFFRYNPDPNSNKGSKLYKIIIKYYSVTRKDIKKEVAGDDKNTNITISDFEIQKRNVTIQEYKSLKVCRGRWLHVEDFRTPFNRQILLKILKEFVKKFHLNN